MAGRLVLLGATGYTGALTAGAMVRRGMRPVLAGRRPEALDLLASELGGLDTARADVEKPLTVRALVERGDVLVSTAGPFSPAGAVALSAAVDAGAHYLDSAGEPGFIREVFEVRHLAARTAGVVALPAMAYASVPGNLAGALALEAAGPGATKVRIGCFDDDGPRGMSGGTRATNITEALQPSFAYRDGSIVGERAAARVGAFKTEDGRRRGVSAGTTEAFSLPRLYPRLEEVDVYLGWMGLDRIARALSVLSLAAGSASRVPALRRFPRRLAARRSSGSGPGAEARARTRCEFLAEATDAADGVLGHVRLEGGNGYDFSAAILAWGAERLLRSEHEGAGVIGPVEAFGLDRLEAGIAECGISRVGISSQ